VLSGPQCFRSESAPEVAPHRPVPDWRITAPHVGYSYSVSDPVAFPAVFLSILASKCLVFHVCVAKW